MNKMMLNAEYKAERLDSLLTTIEEMNYKIRARVEFGTITSNDLSRAILLVSRLIRLSNHFQTENIDSEFIDEEFSRELVELIELSKFYTEGKGEIKWQ